jgi:peptide/nickel transport system substrate-binding protein
MPVLPEHYWKGKNFEATSLAPVVGSGPYTIGNIKPGESITYVRDPDYWGNDLAINKGMWNFDSVTIDYYRDNATAFEAFKKGLADVRIEVDPTRWSTGYDFRAVESGKVLLETVPLGWPAATTAFAFNTRRPLL